MDARGQPHSDRPDEGPNPSESTRTFTILTTLAVVAMVAVAIGSLLFAVGGDDEGDEVATPPPTDEPGPTEPTPPPPDGVDGPDPDPDTVPEDDPPIPTVPDPTLEVGALVETRTQPPGALAAVTADGRLVLIDPATGEEVTEVANDPTPADPPPEPGAPAPGIDGVALGHDGDRVWYSVCCDPPPGVLYTAPVGPDSVADQLANAISPRIGTSPNWVVSGGLIARLDSTTDGLIRFWEPRGPTGVSQATLSPDGSLLAVLEQPADPDEPDQRLLLVTVAELVPTGNDSAEIVDPAPVVAPELHWRQPVFQRDGSLLVARDPGEDGDEPWSLWRMDPATLDATPVEGIDLAGPVLDLDVDPSGEWTLAVVAELDDDSGQTIGSLHWFGPDGSQGTVPGEFLRAAW